MTIIVKSVELSTLEFSQYVVIRRYISELSLRIHAGTRVDLLIIPFPFPRTSVFTLTFLLLSFLPFITLSSIAFFFIIPFCFSYYVTERERCEL